MTRNAHVGVGAPAFASPGAGVTRNTFDASFACIAHRDARRERVEHWRNLIRCRIRARDPAALSDARDAPRTGSRARTSHETRRDIARERSARSRRERGRAREERRAEVVGARVNLCRGRFVVETRRRRRAEGGVGRGACARRVVRRACERDVDAHR